MGLYPQWTIRMQAEYECEKDEEAYCRRGFLSRLETASAPSSPIASHLPFTHPAHTQNQGRAYESKQCVYIGCPSTFSLSSRWIISDVTTVVRR